MRDVTTELKALRLHGMAGAWADLVEQGTLHGEERAGIDASRWLIEHLLQAESTDRAMRSVSHQMNAAKFPVHRDLAGFDFEASKVDRKLIHQLGAMAFTEAAHNVVLVPPRRGRRAGARACVRKPTLNTEWGRACASRRASTSSQRGRCDGGAVGAAMLHHAPVPELAVRAARDVDAGHAAHEGLCVFARLRVGRRCQQPVVADSLEAGGSTSCKKSPINCSPGMAMVRLPRVASARTRSSTLSWLSATRRSLPMAVRCV